MPMTTRSMTQLPYNTSLEIGGVFEPDGPYYNKTIQEMRELAYAERANIIIKTSKDSWYIKKIKETENTITYEEIKRRLNENVINRVKTKSKTWVIYY